MITETDLTTLAAVKLWLSIPTATTSADDTLSSLISACSGDFLRATQRPDLLTATYTEVRQGDGSNRMILYHWPVSAISTLTVAGLSITESSDKIAAGWYLDEDIDPERVFNVYLNAYTFTDGAMVAIEYTTGYATAPPDIAQAVIDWVAYRYKQVPNQGVTQRRLAEGESVQQQQVDAPETTKACIERYRRRIPSISRRFDAEQMRASGAAAFGKAARR